MLKVKATGVVVRCEFHEKVNLYEVCLKTDTVYVCFAWRRNIPVGKKITIKEYGVMRQDHPSIILVGKSYK